MASQFNLDTVQSLYVAYYGRPADPEGLNYWAEQLEANGGNLANIINAFGTSPEYNANLGSSGAASQVNSLYQQLFGRAAEGEGLSFYTNMLNSGEKTLAEIALTIREAAQGTDRTTFEGRTVVANAFTRELDTPEEIAAYSSERGIGIGRTYLQRVTEQTTSEDVLNEAAPVVETLLPATPPSSSGGNNEQPSTHQVLSVSAANGLVLTGAGSVDVLVTGSSPNDTIGPLDLSKITVDGDKTIKVTGFVFLTEANLGDFDVAVAEDSAVFLTAAQASSRTVTGASAATEKAHGGSVAVILDGAAAYDLSDVTAGAGYEGATDITQSAGQLIALIDGNVTLNATTDLGNFPLQLNGFGDNSTGTILTLSAAQASGRIISGDSDDKVIITGLAADTDFSGIATHVNTVIANVAESIDISGNKNLSNITEFKIANNAVLTLSASQAAGSVVTKQTYHEENEQPGAAIITGPVVLLDGESELELNFAEKVMAPFTFANDELKIGEGVTVTLTAAQASGKKITGEGSVTITDLEANTDLSGITVDGTVSIGELTVSEVKALTSTGSFSKIDYSINDTLANILTTADGVQALVKGASTITAGDVGLQGASLTLEEISSGIETVTQLNFGNASVVDVTLTQAQLKTIEASYVNNIAHENAITVTGVTVAGMTGIDSGLASLALAPALNLLDYNDTIVVADEEAIELHANELGALASLGFTIEATTPGVGNDATLFVFNIHDRDNLTATGLIDTFDVFNLTGGQSAVIGGLTGGDKIYIGLINLTESPGRLGQDTDQILQWAFLNEKLDYEVFDNGFAVERVTITLTGVTAVEYDGVHGNFNVTGVGIDQSII